MRILRYCSLVACLFPAVVPAIGQTLTCSSDDGKRHYCRADTRNGVQLVRQRSGSSCDKDYTWGYDERGIWVDRGCRAEFTVNTDRNPSPDRTFSCASDDGKRQYCQAGSRGGVRLVKQDSGSPCRRGETWGVEGDRVWVDRGCRARFAVDDRASTDDGFAGRPADSGQSFTCASDDGHRQTCRANTRNGVRLVRQVSESPCRLGYSWGVDGDIVWVDHGCRAEFGPER